jgi:hypothetical protein
VSGVDMTFSWNNGNVDAGLKLGRCVDVVYVTVTKVRHLRYAA